MTEEILPAGNVRLAVRAASRDDAIREAGAILVEAGAVDPGYVDSMLEREGSVSTYMGNFLAIPHGTNEAKDQIRRSALSVVRYDEPVDWNGEEARFVVGIAGIENEHLDILSKIAIIFSDDDAVQRLVDAATAERTARPALGGQRVVKAVHFGAGNIGRGFVGLLLHDAGYEVVFADVNAELIDALAASDHYTVHEVGADARDRVVDGYRAVNSQTHAAALLDELRTADVATTAVGPDDPAVHRTAPGHGPAGTAGGCPAARDHGVRERDQRHRPAARRDRVALEPRGVAVARGEGDLREHRGRPDRARPGRRRGPRRHRRDVLRVGHRTSAVRRRRPRRSPARTSSTTSRRTSSASSSP